MTTPTMAEIRELQEWLCLSDFPTKIDGIHGPSTKRQLGRFQQAHSVGVIQGELDAETWRALTAPLTRLATCPPLPPPHTIYSAVYDTAIKHLEEHPREVGGANRGPWVRWYMDGNEGPQWAWCVGFALTIARQAYQRLDWVAPEWLPRTYSCDRLAKAAQEADRFYTSNEALQTPGLLDDPSGGWVFLVRKRWGDWTHAGLLLDAYADNTFSTAEGNTNDDGHREGYEAVKRVRTFGTKIDLVRLD
jgi:hypothetical protein